MCAGAIAHARIARLYYAADDPKGGAVVHGPRIFAQPTIHHRPEIYDGIGAGEAAARSEEHTSELQSLMRISYAVFCLKKKKKRNMMISIKQEKVTIINYSHMTNYMLLLILELD